eukprot:CAMPEP_0194305042 /NCGR_PEP_ID=MMETSP0171-20130528/2576_1 /TAXON_ID=218684 /ORGANISM="Corethron pennatum, Strain L29A3" /LENGTH=134 /DNA_ID=CAMNT_0039056453 /DNA_START=51 /DNA_END=452 /DNA_ORIENTATION=+
MSTSRGKADVATVGRILAGELPDEAIGAWVSVLRTLMNEEQQSVVEIGDSVRMSPADFILYHSLETSVEDWRVVDEIYPCSTTKYFLSCGTRIPVHPSWKTMTQILDQHEHKEKLTNVVHDVAALTEGREYFEW